MPDEIDVAQERELLHREASLGASLLRPPQTPSPDCRVCGGEIPEDRRAAVPNCNTCIDCQIKIERRK